MATSTSNRLQVVLFAEDRAHRLFLVPMLRRLCEEAGAAARIRVLSARGGQAVALREYRTYQETRYVLLPDEPTPDLVVVAVDGNCSTFSATRKAVEDATDATIADRLVAACPDPHIERWFLADPPSLGRILGHTPTLGREKCERGHYKKLLMDALRRGRSPAGLYDDPAFTPKVIEEMDLHRAGRNDHSLRAFVRRAREVIRATTGEPEAE